MTVAEIVMQSMSMRKMFSYIGMSGNKWYHKPRPRNIQINQTIAKITEKIGLKRPTYGTRRMAASVSRELDMPVNRKQIQRIYRKTGVISPQKTKKEIMRSNKKLLKPTGPDQLWESDMTYVWCGRDGWCYCFNVIDVFTRKWISYSFDVRADKHAAVDSIVNAIAITGSNCSQLVIRTDNGSQFVSRTFQDAIISLGAKQEFIRYHTPEQNGHVESFHKTLKKEYL